MKNEKKNICFIGADPTFNGGMGLYQKNLIKYIKENYKKINMTIIYFGRDSKNYEIDGVRYIKIKNNFPYPIDQIIDNLKVLKFLRKNNFDIINSHALWGYWMKFYHKKKNQKLIHTYHGVTYNYFKVHLRRFSLIKKIILSPLILFSYLIEKPPIKKADKIICVSEKVRNQLERLYNSKENMAVLRTGVDLREFNPGNKNFFRKKINLEMDNIYGLYVGKGGYWIKGLDRAINLSQKIYNKYKNYKLIIVGAEYNKIKNLIKKDFITYIEKVPREKIPYYYNSSDILFYLSRYDGGAPTLVVSEGMASGCLIAFSKDSKQEIIKDRKNGIILQNFDEKDAERIINLLNDKKKKQEIIKNSIKTIKEFSLEKWGERYLNMLIG
jgi:glycosyltransferase involved in cell wall biosynthesis